MSIDRMENDVEKTEKDRDTEGERQTDQLYTKHIRESIYTIINYKYDAQAGSICS